MNKDSLRAYTGKRVRMNLLLEGNLLLRDGTNDYCIRLDDFKCYTLDPENITSIHTLSPPDPSWWPPQPGDVLQGPFPPDVQHIAGRERGSFFLVPNSRGNYGTIFAEDFGDDGWHTPGEWKLIHKGPARDRAKSTEHKPKPLDGNEDTWRCSCGEVFVVEVGYVVCPKDPRKHGEEK